MKPGETQLFLQHLSQQTMFIDVWDGDSLLPLGSTAVDLKVSNDEPPPPHHHEAREGPTVSPTSVSTIHVYRCLLLPLGSTDVDLKVSIAPTRPPPSLIILEITPSKGFCWNGQL